MTEVQQGSLAEEIERMVHAFSDATRRQRVRELAAKVAELEASEQRHVREWADSIREEEWKRDEATRMRDALETRAEAAEAEVARLRGELDRLRVTTADIETMRQMTEDVRAIGARSEVRAREAALREAAGVCDAYISEVIGLTTIGADTYAVRDCRDRILSLLDAAPAAEVSDG